MKAFKELAQKPEIFNLSYNFLVSLVYETWTVIKANHENLFLKSFKFKYW